MPVHLSKAVLYIFLFYPSVTFYLSLILGVAIPYLADFFLIMVLAIFAILNPARKIRLTAYDLLFFLFLCSVIIFFALNLHNILELFRISEIRYILLIPLLYVLFRLALAGNNSDLNIEQIVRNVLLIHCTWILIEVVLLNLIGPEFVLARGAAVYPERERVFEMIIGFIKPVGLFPGTGNASIAAALLLLLCVHEKRVSSPHFYLALVAVILTFTLTAAVLILLGYIILAASSGRGLLARLPIVLAAISLVIVAIYFQYEIALFRSRGIDFREGDMALTTGFENLELYITTIEDSFARMGWMPHIFSEPSVEEALGPISEIYLLRVGVYFGYATLFILLGLMAWMLIGIFREKSPERKILLVMVFLVLFASFHYPSINGVPLYIFLPLIVWRVTTMKAGYGKPRPALVPAT